LANHVIRLFGRDTFTDALQIHRRVAFLGSDPSGLDPLMQREFLALLAEAREAGRTVFLSSHNHLAA
jgi:ABC-type Mn2+/Zn2+ transport system ATPase subunit